MLDVLDASTARRWAVVLRAAFAARREQIDQLNVYPVPDGDTGTNLYLTLDAAFDTVREARERAGRPATTTLVREAEELTRAALLSARGNSGVILSQILRGFAEAMAQEGPGLTVVDAPLLVRALRGATTAAWASVAHPVEGTILSVASATADAAEALGPDATLGEVTAACVEAARDALRRTPEQLEALARAGVVDAGGAGFLLMVETMDRVVRELTPTAAFVVDEFTSTERTMPSRELPLEEPLTGAPAYEVMYLLDGTTSEAVETLRTQLDGLGDSLLVVGGPELWNVHVHVDDVAAAIERGVEAGRPHRLQVTRFADRTLSSHPLVDLAVVACAAGPGIAALFEQAGATTIASGPGRRASAGQLLAAARASNAVEVILLPNDQDTLMSAQAAARAAEQDGLTIHVIPSRTAVQGIAALAVHDPALTAHRNVLAMTQASSATRHGGLTIAAKAGLTSGGACEVGDVLGIVNGDIVIVGSDRAVVARQVADRLLSSGGELVTLLTGGPGDVSPTGAELAEVVRAHIAETHREAEVEVFDGGQPHYDLLMGVE
ncbi:DAK2 domain-containing protein [Janibacter sp. G1551]|uniref:DAK2 domain-containing protein n=1 Tax=Janibacter sp. G1551 TaxID=3420440 RepID=UPI003D0955DF